ncbi:Uncharacterized protein (Fragment) OS=uncultured bacterium PE=4 SV=1 [Gemmata massiliana]|uniref:Uncharacterized protein n=1 Tax=Gemmata massiliana TaxID=1210884 RepID=A0A6P2D1V6_9BACT
MVVAERFADGLAVVADLDAARRSAYLVRDSKGLAKAAADTAKRDARQAIQMTLHVLSYAAPQSRDTQLRILMDVFCNTPFRRIPRPGEHGYSVGRDCDALGNDYQPIDLLPAWRTDTTVALAAQMYESRDFSAMPILADALQDTGCDNEDILSHCRDPKQIHVRGCWVVDLVLGKE